jgi:hypothetical protein
MARNKREELDERDQQLSEQIRRASDLLAHMPTATETAN